MIVAGKDRASTLVTYVALAAFGVTFLVPFLWSVSTSLKPDGAVFEYPPRWVPRRVWQTARIDGVDCAVQILRAGEGKLRVRVVDGARKGEEVDVPKAEVREASAIDVRWDNYPRAWTAYPFVSFARAYLNTTIVALIVTLGQVVTSSLAAFAFARLRFRGRDAIFFAYLATMMIPGAVTMTPTFVLLKAMPEALNALLGTDYFSRELICGGKVLGLDSYFALIVPRLFSAYGTFLLRQFFMAIPKELEEAARLDGCGTFGVFRRVVLPLSRPAIVTLAIFTFLWAWGDFMWPLLVLNSDEIKTLPILLASFQGQHGTHWNLLMAASVTALVPLLIIFILGQRSFIEGIKLGAVKG